MTELEKIERYVDARPLDPAVYRDAVAIFKGHIEAGEPKWHGVNKEFRKKIAGAIKAAGDATWVPVEAIDRLEETYYKSLLVDSRVDFDAFCQYIERDREPERRFYLPRRKVLGKVAADLQKLETGELKLLCISLPPGVGKSTLALFFISWLGGKHPDKAILTYSHDGGIVKGFYSEILRIIGRDSDEYRYRDVFPGTESQLVGTDAKELRIDLGKRKRFETFQFSSVGAGNAGKYRASELLYCDDLCSGIEEALSKERMDKLWRTYSTDLRQRTSGDPPELHIATRWSVHDVIGRLERNAQDYPTGKEKFIVIPALNEKDESNFDYPMTPDRFTTARYRNLRDTMDQTDWDAIFMNRPIEREGQLYNADELRRFFEVPGEPDGIVAVCDTKDKGSDYAFLPVMYLYGNDCYIVDCVCDNGDPGVVEERLAQILVKYKVQQAQFEANSAGGKVAEKVQGRVTELGGKTKITTKFTTANKETKIIVNAPQVKSRCLFLDASQYRPNSDYGRMMSFLTTYTMAGRNKHDDVPDGMAMAMLYLENMTLGKVQVFRRPF